MTRTALAGLVVAVMGIGAGCAGDDAPTGAERIAGCVEIADVICRRETFRMGGIDPQVDPACLSDAQRICEERERGAILPDDCGGDQTACLDALYHNPQDPRGDCPCSCLPCAYDADHCTMRSCQ